LTGVQQPCIFSELFNLEGMETMQDFATGRFFYFYCYFSKGLPGAR